MRKFTSLVLCFLLCVGQLWAQNRTITGKILDEKGAPIANASIVAKGSTNGVTTIADGSFKISVASTVKALVVSSLNFATQEVTIGTKTVLNITLVSSSSNLDEVIVTGYGTAKKKTEVTGSVVTVNAEKLQNKPTANVLDALQGKVPGLQIYSSSGEPTATPSVRLNGVGSLTTSSTPLYILDGIPMDPGTVLSLNPEDFESVSVLRDASATSIYGSRAANGVIIFTSKKGNPRKPQINLQTQYGVSNLVKPTEDFFNSFMNAEQYTKFLVASGQQTQAQMDATLAATVNKGDTKWYKTYYKENIPTSQIDLNISGGAGKTQYYVSGSYFKQEGLAWRSDYERYTMRANVSTDVFDWFKMGLNLFGGYDKRQTNPYGSNNLNRGLAFLAAPYLTPNNPTTGQQYEFIPGLFGSGAYHPEYLSKKITSDGNNLQVNPSGFLQLNPIKNVTLLSRAGIEFFDYRQTGFTLPSFIGATTGGVTSGTIREQFDRSTTKTITNTIEYKFNVTNRHRFTALAGQEFINNNSTGLVSSGQGLTDDRLILLSNAPNSITATSYRTEYAYKSYFGRLNYSLDSKYFLELSLRNDESSRFGRDLRGATFYSVGGSWQAKKETFLSNVSWLTDLVVKASIGTSGNSNIGNYDGLAKSGSNVNTAYNGVTGLTASDPGNPELSWETQRQINFGFQTTLFKRLNIEAEFFHRKTTDMLLDVPFPFTSGFSSVKSNVGSLVNQGINVNVNYDLIKNRNAYLNVYTNLGYVEQKVTELFQGKQFYSIPNTGVTWAVNQPVNFYYPVFSHVDPTTGLPLWYVPNADPNQVINTNKDNKNVTSVFNSTALLQNTGIKRYAPFNGGFGLSGGYKGFSVGADFTFSSGKYLINNDRYFFENPSVFSGYNQNVNVLDYWKKPGDITRFPKYGVQFTQFDSRLIEDASFVRLKTLTVAYNVPKSILDKTKAIKGVKFYVTFRNLLTFTKYSGPDPEVDSNLSLGANPNTRQTAVGLNFQF